MYNLPLFVKFGNGLQQMLTTVQYSELSGQYNIEVDAVFTVAKLMRRWLTRPEVLMSISSNPITGKPMSEEMAKKIIEGQSLCNHRKINVKRDGQIILGLFQ